MTNPDNSTILRDASAWAGGGVAIASENEWFKAAYYDPTINSGSGGYWLYPTRSNTGTTATTPNNTDANSVNRDGSLEPYSFNVTPVGGYELASSYYGTFDQGGNIDELNDQIVVDPVFGNSNRGRRGGSLGSIGDSHLQSSSRRNWFPDLGNLGIGFRVTSLAPILNPYASVQTIDFPPIPDQVTTNTVTLSATADSGLAVNFAVESGPADLSGSLLSFTAAGTVSVVALQGGDANWNPAPSVTNTFAVTAVERKASLFRFR